MIASGLVRLTGKDGDGPVDHRRRGILPQHRMDELLDTGGRAVQRTCKGDESACVLLSVEWAPSLVGHTQPMCSFHLQQGVAAASHPLSASVALKLHFTGKVYSRDVNHTAHTTTGSGR